MASHVRMMAVEERGITVMAADKRGRVLQMSMDKRGAAILAHCDCEIIVKMRFNFICVFRDAPHYTNKFVICYWIHIYL
jgi:hypothetical protein